MITKTETGRWRVRVFHLGQQVASTTRDAKRDAVAWETEQKRTLISGAWLDPRRGDVRLGDVIEAFNEHRVGSISAHAYDTDESNLRLHVPAAMKRRPIGTIDKSQMEDVYSRMLRTHARGTVSRFRDTCVALFGYARARGYIGVNVGEEARVPRGSGAVIDVVRPLNADQLTFLIASARKVDAGYANLVELASLTGLRWGELVELRVSDIVDVPLPALRVSRSKSDGYEIGATKSRRSRRVPLVDRALVIALEQVKGKTASALLFVAPRGGQVNAGNFKRALNWKAASSGHRVHDLRHTAATGWIAMGMDVKTVSVWLGHSNSAITHRIYSGWLDGDSDLAAVRRLQAAIAAAAPAASKEPAA